jgi:hypothetical protein
MTKHLVESEFEVIPSDGAVEVIFIPTSSHYTFSRLSNRRDIASRSHRRISCSTDAAGLHCGMVAIPTMERRPCRHRSSGTYRCRSPRGWRGWRVRKECAAKARNHSRVA